MRELKIIFSDLGNVLLFWEDRIKYLSTIASYLLGKPIDQTELKNQLSFLLTTESGEDAYENLDTGKITASQFYQAVLSVLQLTAQQLPEDRFWPLYASHLQPIIPVVKLWQKLQRKGYFFVAVNNGNNIYVADLIAVRFKIQWAAVIISSQIGVKKPNPRFFQAALDVLNKNTKIEKMEFGNCLLVDDIQSYCDAFSALGGQAICFNASKESIGVLKEKLVRLGIK